MSEQRRKSRYTAESETELNAVAAENNNLQEDFYNEKSADHRGQIFPHRKNRQKDLWFLYRTSRTCGL